MDDDDEVEVVQKTGHLHLFTFEGGDEASVEYTSYQGGNRVWNNRQQHHQQEMDEEDELSSSTRRRWMKE